MNMQEVGSKEFIANVGWGYRENALNLQVVEVFGQQRIIYIFRDNYIVIFRDSGSSMSQDKGKRSLVIGDLTYGHSVTSHQGCQERES